jgi:hypothetical protein
MMHHNQQLMQYLTSQPTDLALHMATQPLEAFSPMLPLFMEKTSNALEV